MKIIKSSFEIEPFDGVKMLRKIEKIARVCYKSEGLIDDLSYAKMIQKLIDNGHEAMIEHDVITVKFICDRGVSNELVRHRIASFAQESTRYCNYSKDKFNNEITVIMPPFADDFEYSVWVNAMAQSETAYFNLIDIGCTPQIARSVLPNSLKTEIYITMNPRAWRNFFKLRTAKSAHPQMRELAIPLLAEFQSLVPIIFDDIKVG